MPDFRLSKSESRAVADYLLSIDEKRPMSELVERLQTFGLLPYVEPVGRTPLTLFEITKAESLLQNKLSCLGCHAVNGTGGKIGSDLTNVGNRLHPFYLLKMIEHPNQIVTDSVMPTIPMPPSQKHLIINYLTQSRANSHDQEYLPLTSLPLIAYNDLERPDQLYGKYCSACHGSSGKGDGFNASFLRDKPADLSDAAVMSKRPDDTLFDGIYAGCYILDKSNLMPPFGLTLSHEEIRSLVAHIRTLCQCEGPTWLNDGTQSANPTN